MAAKGSTVKRLTPTQLREENERLKDLLENCTRCVICDTVKRNDKFYMNFDPMCKSQYGTVCKDCARKIALRVDKNGEEHEPTKESIQLALKYLNKPFLNKVWDASIAESENEVTGKTKSNVWTSYAKNIQMPQWAGMLYENSDHLKTKDPGGKKTRNPSVNKILKEHEGMDTYDSFLKNKEDVIRLLDYDPFENELVTDQPFLYSQLIGLLDSGGSEVNEDMIRTSSAISIARWFLQAAKIDDTIARLMADVTQLEKNSATIKSLQESKGKLIVAIRDLAAESCLSLKNSKNSIKGENTWTGKVKKIKDLNLRDGAVNGFDIATCKGMRQVQEISDASIMKQLALDESEWSDMVAEMRVANQDLRQERDQYKEINRILLQENLDLKDFIDEQKIDHPEYRDLKDMYSVFAGIEEEEVDEDESESTSD